MAYIICPKHGGHGTAAACMHAVAAVIAGERLGRLFAWRVDFEGQRLGPLWFCEACAVRYGIPPDGLLSSGEEGLDRWWCSGWQPVCPVCFRESGGPDDD